MDGIKETNQYRVIFASHTNDHDNLYGGLAMEWMDETAYIAGIRYCRQRMVTNKVEHVDFIKGIPRGSIINIKARVVDVGVVRMKVKVEIECQEMCNGEPVKAVEGMFELTPVNDQKQPVRINKQV